MDIGIAIDNLTIRVRGFLSKLRLDIIELANENGDVNEVFNVFRAIDNDDLINKAQIGALITSLRTDIQAGTSSPLIVGTPTDLLHVINVGYLTPFLDSLSPYGGDPTMTFKVADALNADEGINLSQLEAISSNVDNYNIGDIVVSATDDLLDGFELYGSSDVIAQISEYQDLVDSGSNIVANVNAGAGTFTIKGHGMGGSIGTSITYVGSTVTVNKSLNNSGLWKERHAKVENGVYQYAINLIEVYDGGLQRRHDPAPTNVRDFAGPLTGSNGHVYRRAVLQTTYPYELKGWTWNKTWTESYTPVNTVNKSMFYKLKVR